jgi:hypothetical protein
MATVYRVEDERGYGPYCGDSPIGYEGNETHRPTPHSDGLPNQYDRHGFISIEALVRWFDAPNWRRPSVSDIQALRLAGFKIVKYDVPEGALHRGKRQVQFDPDRAVRL